MEKMGRIEEIKTNLLKNLLIRDRFLINLFKKHKSALVIRGYRGRGKTLLAEAIVDSVHKKSQRVYINSGIPSEEWFSLAKMITEDIVLIVDGGFNYYGTAKYYLRDLMDIAETTKRGGIILIQAEENIDLWPERADLPKMLELRTGTIFLKEEEIK